MKLLLLLSFVLSISSAQITRQVVECCGMTMQDVDGRVVMESTRILAEGTYKAVIVRVCVEEPFFVQVWTQLAPNSFQLKWQLVVNSTEHQTMHGPIIISFDIYPLSLSKNDRLGFYSPSTTTTKLSVPYSLKPDASYDPSLSFSDINFNASQTLTPGLVISLLNVALPRTFGPYVKFCLNSSNCPSLTGDLNPPVTASYLNYVSVPSTCCEKSVTCDSNNTIGSQLANQLNLMNSLMQTIIQLQNIVNSLLNSTINTGWCPPGFVSGFYGIGFCYKVVLKKLQLAEAAVSCDSFDRSRVVFILTSLEDSFISNMLQNNQTSDLSGTKVKYWTSALFNRASQNWYWYNYQLLRNEVFANYRHWKNKEEPTPDMKDDVCATYTYDRAANDYYWEKANCSEPNYYICKLPKQCL